MKKNNRPIWQVVLLDVLLTGLILLTFAFFHHGYLWMKTMAMQKRLDAQAPTVSQTTVPEPVQPTEPEPVIDPIVEPEDPDEPTEDNPIEGEEPEEVIPEEPDNRTEWQKKFADKFTDEVVWTENSYTSPNVSINVETVVTGSGSTRVCYYVADIYVASIDCFRTWLANDTFAVYSTQNILEMDRDSNAIISMTGDFYSYQYNGLMVRNGVQYRDHHSTSDVCVLYADGTMETLHKTDYTPEELLKKDIWQIWDFGPALLTADGELPSSYNVSTSVSYINPRSSVGYYEPGHYCFVVVDGRNSQWSQGMRLPELSKVYYELGCKAAYNLDGGGSAVLAFNDQIISKQSNGGGRELGDILLIGEPTGLPEGMFDHDDTGE